MPAPASNRAVNHLIDGLPTKQRQRVLAQCTPVELSFGDVLCDSEEPFTHVYFPLTCFISLVSGVSGQRPIEMTMIGKEGMLGATFALGVNTTPLQSIVQGSGSALRMRASHLGRHIRDTPALRRTLDRYIYVLMAQLAQTAACNRFHEVQARLARWLLMTHDRTQGDHLKLTHLFLSEMLGVRRSAVSIAAAALQQRKLIRYTRGIITVVSRHGLEAASCECYGKAVRAYDRRLPITTPRARIKGTRPTR